MYLRSLLFLGLLQCATCVLRWSMIHNNSVTGVPPKRRDAAMTFDAATDKIVVFGGRVGYDRPIKVLETVYGDTWIYDINTRKWREVVTDPSPGKRYNAVSGLSGKYFYVSMGDANGTQYGDIWRFNLQKETWEELPTGLGMTPRRRADAVGGIYQNDTRFYLTLGSTGVTDFLDIYSHSDVISYDLNTQMWYRDYKNPTAYNPSHPHGRTQARGLMVAPDEMFVFGGCMDPGACPTGDSWIFEGRRKTWTQLKYCATPKMYPSVAMLPTADGTRRLVVYGGDEMTSQVLMTEEAPADEVAVLNLNSKIWDLRRVSDKSPPRRFSASMTTGRLGIYMFGGYDKSNTFNDLWYLVGDGKDADLSPVTSACIESYFSLIMLHGVLMALGWGFFIHWGAFTARFMSKRSKARIYIHMTFQIFGYLVAVAGLVCGILAVQFSHFRSVHGILGLVIMVLGLQQGLNGPPGESLLKKKPRASPRLRCWQWWHKNSGRTALLLALVNISLGIFIGSATMLLWSLWFGYLAMVVFLHFITQCVSGIFKGDDEEHDYEDIPEDIGLKSKEPDLAYLHESEGMEMKTTGGIDNPALEAD